jgi:hypothetical protein
MMGPRFQGAAGPSIGATTRATQNIGKGVAKTTATRALPAVAAVRILGPVKSFNWSMYAFAAYHGYRPFYESIGPERKLGVRYGGEGTVSLAHVVGKIGPGRMYVLPYYKKIRVPAFGYGIAAVPSDESRWISSRSSGAPGQSPGNPEEPSPAVKDSRGVRPPSNGGSVPSPGRRPGSSSRGEATSTIGTPKKITPWCPVHRRRHWCGITRSRR